MPFAPAILDKYYKKYFDCKNPSYYMQKAVKIKTNLLNLYHQLFMLIKPVEFNMLKNISPKF